MTKEASSSQHSTQEMAVTTNQAQQEEPNMKKEMNEKNETTVMSINVKQLTTPNYHPRTSDADIKSLADSIKRDGLHIPLTVMQDGDSENYIVLDGSRRKVALEKLGEQSAPCIVKTSAEDADAAHTSYVINMERITLNPIEQALHIKKMKDDFGYANRELTVKGYGSTALISKKLKVLGLSEPVQKYIVEGKLTESHGRKLLKLKTTDEQENMAKQAIESELPASKLKNWVTRHLEKSKNKKAPKAAVPNSPDKDIEGVYFKDSQDMSELPEETVHLIVTSPPYGIGKDFEKDYSFETMFEETKEVFSECARVLVPGGIMAINFMDIQNFMKKRGNTEYKEWLFTGPLIQNALRRHNIILTDVIQWMKPIPWLSRQHYNFNDKDQHTSYRIINQTEQVLILRKKGERQEPEGAVKLKSRLSKEQWREWCPNVWDIRPVHGQNKEGHPSVYPVELCDRLIKMFSFEGDTVLDPWLGSGTTVKVARDLNRNGIGYERELEYKPVIMKKLGLLLEEDAAGQQGMMTKYAEESLAESVKQEPTETFITNMSTAAMETACQDYYPALPA